MRFQQQGGRRPHAVALTTSCYHPRLSPPRTLDGSAMSNQTLNHYRIAQELGRGGMGEVYAAEDTRLHRRVALKILPAAFASDPERRQRFEREAHTVAALNHPNIVTIYSVEQAADVTFLTMELVDGKTLADLLPSDGLPLPRLLQIAIPLADAISAAHARGIIHRDLKPANVMVTAEGRVKVLDFGLAKLKEPVAAGNLTTMPAEVLSGEGRIFGTVAYMSPEQAEGRDIDHRSDVFSFGVLLYELATGERPFKGDTSLSLISSILKDTPQSITELKPTLPRELGRVIRRCLAKDPGRRYQSAIDLRNELEEIKQDLDSGELTANPIAGERRPVSTGYPRAVWIALGAVAFSTAIALGYFGWRRAADRPPPRVERLQLQPPSGVRVSESGASSLLAISPDGQWIAFHGTGDRPGRTGLYLRSTGELEAQRIGPGSSPFFSPDSRWLGFAADGMMWKVPVAGGEPQRICEVVTLRGASWGDDGVIVFSTGEGLLRVSADGGDVTALTSPPDGERHYWPHVLPGSRAAVFTLHQGLNDSFQKIAVVSLATSEIRPFAALSGSYPRYVPPGHLVYGWGGSLHVVRFDATRLEPVGEPRVVLDDVYFYRGSGYRGFDVAASGALTYMPGAPRVEDAELVWLDRQGQIASVLPARRSYDWGAALSPEGDRIAVTIRTTLDDSALWVHDTVRGGWTRLTSAAGDEGDAIWSRDGRWIVFTSFASGHGNLFRVAADGSGAPEQLTSGVRWDYAGGVSPDGNVLIFMRQVEAAQWDLMTLRLEPGEVPRPLLATPVGEAWPAFSPDGRWVAYESFETGSGQIHVRPYPGPGRRTTVSTAGGSAPFWSRDGRELFYRRGQEVWSAAINPGASFSSSAPRLLFTVEFLPSSAWGATLAVAPDGQRFLAVRPAPRERTERLLVYVPNWLQELN